MDIFLKLAAGTLVSLILYLILLKQGKDISGLLTTAVCCILAVGAMEYITPVIVFIDRLQEISGLDSTILQIILRTVGISILAEITSVICQDAGNAALGKSLQILAGAVVLWLSIPLFNQLLDLVEELLLAI